MRRTTKRGAGSTRRAWPRPARRRRRRGSRAHGSRRGALSRHSGSAQGMAEPGRKASTGTVHQAPRRLRPRGARGARAPAAGPTAKLKAREHRVPVQAVVHPASIGWFELKWRGPRLKCCHSQDDRRGGRPLTWSTPSSGRRTERRSPPPSLELASRATPLGVVLEGVTHAPSLRRLATLTETGGPRQHTGDGAPRELRGLTAFFR